MLISVDRDDSDGLADIKIKVIKSTFATSGFRRPLRELLERLDLDDLVKSRENCLYQYVLKCTYPWHRLAHRRPNSASLALCNCKLLRQ